MTTNRVRWHDDGSKFVCGHAGSFDRGVLKLYMPEVDGDEWVLVSELPGQEDVRRYADDPDALKPEAEKLLAEFVVSLGAVFPEDTTRTSVQWAVAYGCPSGNPNEGALIRPQDDEEDAREDLGWSPGDFLVRRTVTAGRWERVDPGTEGSTP